jgi:hypothetical protein
MASCLLPHLSASQLITSHLVLYILQQEDCDNAESRLLLLPAATTSTSNQPFTCTPDLTHPEMDVQVAFLERPPVCWHTLILDALEGVGLDHLTCSQAMPSQ